MIKRRATCYLFNYSTAYGFSEKILRWWYRRVGKNSKWRFSLIWRSFPVHACETSARRIDFLNYFGFAPTEKMIQYRWETSGFILHRRDEKRRRVFTEIDVGHLGRCCSSEKWNTSFSTRVGQHDQSECERRSSLLAACVRSKCDVEMIQIRNEVSHCRWILFN